MRPEVEEDWGRADRFRNQIAGIISENAGAIISVRLATPDEDLRQATDLVVETERSGDVATRVRFNCDWRDLTLRCARLRGGEWVYGWEAEKIARGFARWYCYVWVMGGEVEDWIFVDLDVIRMAGFIVPPVDGEPGWLVKGRLQPNPDRVTQFTWIQDHEIEAAGALVARAEPDIEQLDLPF